MTRLRKVIAGPALLVLAWSAAPALADETAVGDGSSVNLAERRAAEAFAAYNKKEYAAAIALYLEAYDATPSGAILYNIARIYDLKLHNRPSAIAFYRRYVADAGAQPDMIDIANHRLQQLRSAELATAMVADEASGAAPTADRAAAARSHDPSRRAAGDDAQERHGGWSNLRWAGVLMGAAGLAGVGVGSGFGLAAMSRAGTAHDQCDGNACSSQQGVDAARAARSDAAVANIGFAAGGALLLTGVALYFLGGDSAGGESHVRLEAHPNDSAVSVQVAGRW